MTPRRARDPAATGHAGPSSLLFVAAFGFFAAGGIVLPVATRFAAGPLGADAIGVGVAIGAFAIAALASAAGGRLGVGPLRPAALLHPGRRRHGRSRWSPTWSPTSCPLFVVVRAAVRRRRGVLLRRRPSPRSATSRRAERRGEAINIALAGALPRPRHRAVHRRGDPRGAGTTRRSGSRPPRMAGCGTGLACSSRDRAGRAGRGGRRTATHRAAACSIRPASCPGVLILAARGGWPGSWPSSRSTPTAIGLGGAGGPAGDVRAHRRRRCASSSSELPDEIGAAPLSGGAARGRRVGLASSGSCPARRG